MKYKITECRFNREKHRLKKKCVYKIYTILLIDTLLNNYTLYFRYRGGMSRRLYENQDRIQRIFYWPFVFSR